MKQSDINIAKGTTDPRVEFISQVLTQMLIKFQFRLSIHFTHQNPDLKLKLKILTKPFARSLNKNLTLWPNFTLQICSKLELLTPEGAKVRKSAQAPKRRQGAAFFPGALYEACTRPVRYEKHFYFKMLITFEPNVAQRSVASQNDHKSKACLPEASNTASSMHIGPKSLILAPQEILDISGYQWGFGRQFVKAYNNENPVTNQKIL